jgi:hypothetical protein
MRGGVWDEFNTSYCTETLEAVTAGMGHCFGEAGRLDFSAEATVVS